MLGRLAGVSCFSLSPLIRLISWTMFSHSSRTEGFSWKWEFFSRLTRYRSKTEDHTELTLLNISYLLGQFLVLLDLAFSPGFSLELSFVAAEAQPDEALAVIASQLAPKRVVYAVHYKSEEGTVGEDDKEEEEPLLALLERN